MQFKHYKWPHNPRTYEIFFERDIAVHKVPFGRYSMQNLGMNRRVLKGEGEFFGEDAYDQFKQLVTLFCQESPGMLIHPVWQNSMAYFVELSLTQKPKKDYVEYRFTFWECFDQTKQLLRPIYHSNPLPDSQNTRQNEKRNPRYHTVVSGETLWHIARKYDMTLPDLLKRNPQIKNPNLIYPGQKVVVI